MDRPSVRCRLPRRTGKRGVRCRVFRSLGSPLGRQLVDGRSSMSTSRLLDRCFLAILELAERPRVRG
jgi:hypothetical protein